MHAQHIPMPRHAQVIPSLALPFISQKIHSWAGSFAPHQFMRWEQQEDLTETARRDLRNAIVRRLRTSAKELWQTPINIELPDQWSTRMTTDTERIRNVIARFNGKPFKTLTLREFRMGFGGSVEQCLCALARLEALDWTPPPPPTRKGEPALQLPPMQAISTVQELADRVLSFPWLTDAPSTDLRFAHPSHSNLRDWIGAHLKGNMVQGHIVDLLMGLDEANQMTAADEMKALALAARIQLGPKYQAGDRQLGMYLARTLGPKRDGAKLQEVATMFSVTRQRIMQVCDNFTQTLRGQPSVTPALDRLLQALEDASPCSIPDATQKLSHLIGTDVGIECLITWAESIGRKNITIKVHEVRTLLRGQSVFTGMIDKTGAAPWVTHMIRHISRDKEMFGCTNLLRIAGFLALKDGFTPDQETMEKVLEATSEFRWLDKTSDWFTLGESDACSAANRVRKIMAVAHDHVGADQITAILASDDAMIARGVNAAAGLGMSIPPIHVLRELMRGWTWLDVVQKGRFAPNEKFNPVGCLTRAEEIAVAVIERHGGVACKFEILNEVLAELDVTSMTVHQLVGQSPIILRTEHGLYQLNGRRLSDETLPAARNRYRIKAARLSDSGDFSSNIFRLRVTEAALRNEQHSMPIRFKHIQGQTLDVCDAHGQILGKARVGKNRPAITGLNRIFKPAANDELRVEILENMLRVEPLASPTASRSLSVRLSAGFTHHRPSRRIYLLAVPHHTGVGLGLCRSNLIA